MLLFYYDHFVKNGVLVSTISDLKMPVKWAFFFYPWKNPWKIYGNTIFCIYDLGLC